MHRAQKLLLDTLYLIATMLPVEFPRPYLSSLPTNDRFELENQFSENILFAAQALTHGFRIRGIELYSGHLRPFAQKLAAALEAVRFVFRMSSFQSVHDLFLLSPVMQDFLAAWADFEREICTAYFGLADADRWVALLVRTMKVAISNRWIEHADVIGMEPFLMFGLPRVAVTLDMKWTARQTWFKPQRVLAARLEKQIALLPQTEVEELQHWLLDNPSVPSVREKWNQPILADGTTLGDIFRDVATLVDDLQGGKYAKEFTCILGRAFTIFDDLESADVVAEGEIAAPKPVRKP